MSSRKLTKEEFLEIANPQSRGAVGSIYDEVVALAPDFHFTHGALPHGKDAVYCWWFHLYGREYAHNNGPDRALLVASLHVARESVKEAIFKLHREGKLWRLEEDAPRVGEFVARDEGDEA